MGSKKIETFDAAADARVIVVGGGVSGCACAARLSCLGASVLVVSSALDVVGLPGYGPVLDAGESGWAGILEAFSLLPEALRWAWLGSAWLLESGDPTLIVDRRAISVETKRCVEQMPGVSFRQGLVVAIRHVADAMEVETAFGEIFEADVVVLAPGLALRGEMAVGDDRPAGGRYGEVPANELHDVLARMGMKFRETEVHVGAHLSDEQARDLRRRFEPMSANSPRVAENRSSDVAVAVVSLAELMTQPDRPCSTGESLADDALAEVLRAVKALGGGETNCRAWPEGFPLPPYWTQTPPHPAIMGLSVCTNDETGTDQEVWLVPDGTTTCEWYVASRSTRPDAEQLEERAGVASGRGDVWDSQSAGLVASRLEYSVKAMIVDGVDEKGKTEIGQDRIWVVGRCAGARNYLESLLSGVRAADSLIDVFGSYRSVEGFCGSDMARTGDKA